MRALKWAGVEGIVGVLVGCVWVDTSGPKLAYGGQWPDRWDDVRAKWSVRGECDAFCERRVDWRRGFEDAHRQHILKKIRKKIRKKWRNQSPHRSQ